jgi:hypothetical protein
MRGTCGIAIRRLTVESAIETFMLDLRIDT